MREEYFNNLKNIVDMKFVKNGKFKRLRGVAENYRKLQETPRIEQKEKNVKSAKKIAEKKKVHFQRSDGLPEIIYGTVDVPFKNSTSAKSGFELVKKIAKLLHQELLDFKDVYFS